MTTTVGSDSNAPRVKASPRYQRQPVAAGVCWGGGERRRRMAVGGWGAAATAAASAPSLPPSPSRHRAPLPFLAASACLAMVVEPPAGCRHTSVASSSSRPISTGRGGGHSGTRPRRSRLPRRRFAVRPSRALAFLPVTPADDSGDPDDARFFRSGTSRRDVARTPTPRAGLVVRGDGGAHSVARCGPRPRVLAMVRFKFDRHNRPHEHQRSRKVKTHTREKAMMKRRRPFNNWCVFERSGLARKGDPPPPSREIFAGHGLPSRARCVAGSREQWNHRGGDTVLEAGWNRTEALRMNCRLGKQSRAER